jgi:hypothetical protein
MCYFPNYFFNFFIRSHKYVTEVAALNITESTYTLFYLIPIR